MSTWLRRIRAAIGMGLTWAVAWSGAGFLLARLGVNTDLPLALLFAPLGFISGITFSGIIAVIEARRDDRISLPRFAGWGATGGALLSGIITLTAALGGRSAWAEFLTFGPALIIAGAASAAGSLALARRAGAPELPGPDGHVEIAPPRSSHE